jgi:NTP pyrophosphatase (non-canonical NTP hydrolase)
LYSLAKEIGDALWALANLAEDLGYDFDEIATMNLEKLKSRQNRGKLSGSGDNR